MQKSTFSSLTCGKVTSLFCETILEGLCEYPFELDWDKTGPTLCASAVVCKR